MPVRLSVVFRLICLIAVCTATLQAQVARPVSGFYGSHTLQLVVAPDGSFTGNFYDETVAGRFSCGFLIKSTAAPSKDGVYKIVSWWPFKELGEPIDDDFANGTLRVSVHSLTLQLPKDAHGGCWNVNGDLNNGDPVDLERDLAKPAWKALRVLKSKRVPLRQQPSLTAPSHPYIVQGDVLVVTDKQGPWVHVDYYNFSTAKSYTGWLQESDLLPVQ